MRIIGFYVLALLAMPAAAQDTGPIERTIQVVGNGKVSTPPNVAMLQYSLAGEGKTPDEASRDLVTMREAIRERVGGLLGDAAFSDSNLVILAARGPACDDASGYNAQPRLSRGDCAVTGYLATSQSNIRTTQIAKAGTAVGLVSRLGARDARLQGFELADDRAAKRAALTAAVTNATQQAEAIAAAAGRRLGPILTIRDQNSGYGTIVVTAERVDHLAAPAPPPPPVEITMEPRPIDTHAQVHVTFALLP